MDNNLNYSSEVRKKILSMLMFQLYSDERTIYREYVQNALDSINKAIETIFATMLGIILNYKKFTSFDFIYKNIDLEAEIATIFSEFERIVAKTDYSYDIIRVKRA